MAGRRHRRAAAGWAGDRFAVYESSKGEVLLASLSTWDTENDAREFFDAYVKRTQLRYPDAIPIDALPKYPLPARTISLRTSEGVVIIQLIGPRVLIVEGLSERVAASLLLKGLQ